MFYSRRDREVNNRTMFVDRVAKNGACKASNGKQCRVTFADSVTKNGTSKCQLFRAKLSRNTNGWNVYRGFLVQDFIPSYDSKRYANSRFWKKIDQKKRRYTTIVEFRSPTKKKKSNKIIVIFNSFIIYLRKIENFSRSTGQDSIKDEFTDAKRRYNITYIVPRKQEDSYMHRG